MKKLSVIIIALFITVASLGLVARPAFAEENNCENGVPTAILGGEDNCFETKDDGSGIVEVLKIVVDILTVGVGILGVVGISIVGVQYLTAGDNEEKTRKAKRRMFEIVLGLIAYVLAYALLYWLIPDFKGINI